MCRRRCRPSRARRSGRSSLFARSKIATRSPPARASARSTRQRPKRLAPPRSRPGRIGIARDDDHAAQFRVLPERVAQRTRRVERPEVLILEVDQRACVRERLLVGAGDAALAVGCERIGLPPCRIRAEHLDRVAATRSRHPARRRQTTTFAAACELSRWRSIRHGLGVSSGWGSSHRSRNVCATSATAGPVSRSCMSCHGGRSP